MEIITTEIVKSAVGWMVAARVQRGSLWKTTAKETWKSNTPSRVEMWKSPMTEKEIL